MSICCTSEAWKTILPPHIKLVLLYLADNGSPAGAELPPVRRICERCCLFEADVYIAIAALVTLGFLHFEGGVEASPAIYRLFKLPLPT